MDRSTVNALLRECGATLIRTGKHEVWRLPNGSNFVRAVSPSDQRAYQNQLSELKRLLGLNGGGQQGKRRKKRPTRGPSRQPWGGMMGFNNVLGDKLTEAGVVAEELKRRVDELTASEAHWKFIAEDRQNDINQLLKSWKESDVKQRQALDVADKQYDKMVKIAAYSIGANIGFAITLAILHFI